MKPLASDDLAPLGVELMQIVAGAMDVGAARGHRLGIAKQFRGRVTVSCLSCGRVISVDTGKLATLVRVEMVGDALATTCGVGN